MPTQLPANCSIGAIIEREDPRDALVVRKDLPYKTLAELPAGSVVGTSSVRRMAQVSRMHPSLVLADMRGNVPRRVQKLDDTENFRFDALILAAAGLLRLNMADRISDYLSAPSVLHAVGQGAIGIETRDGDEEISALIHGLNHTPTSNACYAERALLRTLEGGCSVPIGVQTSWEDEGRVLAMQAIVASVDGQQVVECEERCPVSDQDQAEVFGRAVAKRLVDLGALPILQEIERKKLAKEAKDRELAAAQLS